MAFVNEYISDHDKQRYNFWKLTMIYAKTSHPPNIRGFLKNHDWTIDRERGIWLSWFRCDKNSIIKPVEYRYGGSFDNFFILHYDATNIEVHLFLEEESQTTRPDKTPFIVIWRFVSLTPSSVNSASEAQLKTVLKEALTAYGHAGIGAQGTAKEAIVQFSNF